MPIIKDWSKITKAAVDYLLVHNNLIGFDRIQNILVFTFIISNYFNNCNNRKTRDLNSNNEYCFTIPGKIFHYDETNKKNKIIYNQVNYHNPKHENYYIHTFNLGKINPVKSFNKIEFLGDINDDCWGTRTEWCDRIYNNKFGCDTTYVKGENLFTYFKDQDNKFKHLIKEMRINNSSSLDQIKDAASIYLQSFTDENGLANIEVRQRFGLTWYFDEKDSIYYLQIIIYQWSGRWVSWDCYDVKNSFKIGSDIRLYND